MAIRKIITDIWAGHVPFMMYHMEVYFSNDESMRKPGHTNPNSACTLHNTSSTKSNVRHLISNDGQLLGNQDNLMIQYTAANEGAIHSAWICILATVTDHTWSHPNPHCVGVWLSKQLY